MNEEIDFIIDGTKEAMEAAMVNLNSQLQKIRAGKASPMMLSKVQVELLKIIRYSETIKLNDVSSQCNLSMGETRSFIYGLIHKGFLKADLGKEDLSNNPTLRAV